MHPHTKLIVLARKFIKELGYKEEFGCQENIKGFCHGSSALVTDAVLTSKSAIDNFNTELAEINRILAADEQHSQIEHTLSPEDKNKLLSFLRKMMPHQYPRGYISDQKSDSITYNTDIEKTLNSFQSEGLKELGGLHKAATFSGFYNLANDTDIGNYISALQETVLKALASGVNIPFSLLMNNGRHACQLGYRPDDKDPTKPGKWYVYDINQGKENPGKIHEINFDDIELLKTFLIWALSTGRKQDSKSHYAIAANLYCSKNNENEATQLSAHLLSTLDEHKLTHITAEKMEQGAFGNSLLFIAAQNGDINTVNALIQQGVNLNVQNSHEYSALFVAAKNGHTEIVESLITADADLNLKTGSTSFGGDRAAIRCAAFHGHIDIVKLLIDNGADASYLHCDTAIFEEKFFELMGKNPLTVDDKKCLVKLYIILRTSEEANIANYVKRSVTSFFKPENAYPEKIKVARDLLKALDNEENDFSSKSPALQDSRLKKIYALCFPEPNVMAIHSGKNPEHLQVGVSSAHLGF